MRYHAVFALWIALLVLFGALVVAEEYVFAPTEEQRALLREGVAQTKILEERYSNFTLTGMTEHLNSYDPESERRWTEHFRFARLGHQYCLLEIHASNLRLGNGVTDTEETHMVRLINPRASYGFESQGQNDSPPFSLSGKTKIENNDDLVNVIDILVQSNWVTGSAPFSMSVDLSCPFDISTARAASSKQGGYIKGIAEEIIDGERVVTLKMGYYYGDGVSNGEVSFYRDHYWAVKEAVTGGIRQDTGKVDVVFKTNNVYDFSDTFPRLTKTSFETWDAEGKKLLESEISTITSIDFTPPDVAVFDPTRFVSNAEIDAWGAILPRQRLSPFQIAGIVIGLLLIAWGLGLRFWTPKKHENEQ